jgi:DUF1680 family protein
LNTPDLKIGHTGDQMDRRSFMATVVIAPSAAAIGGVVEAQKPGRAAPRAVTPKIRAVAAPLPLTAVRLTGGPLKRAQQRDAEYLLSLDPDRMLSFYRTRAGLAKKAEPYGGWDGEGRQLTGHIAGHHLSAVSYMYAATGDPRFKQRADYLVGELKVVQDAHKNGYVGAIMGGEEAFDRLAKGEIRSAAFDLNGLWSPWYTLHKTFAGLRDAYRHTGNRTALDVEIRFAQWAEGILSHLDDAQTQKMLGTEFGGMNEVLADLYADTGDTRWLDLSYHFEYRAVVDPWKHFEDDLNGLHGNATIPKAIGSLSRYVSTGRLEDGLAASFFWETVVRHHTFASGGDGKDEYFRAPDHLSSIIDGRTAESCNVYNMLKLTRGLFALRPDVEYAEFQERALFNHALGSMDPDDFAMCYMVPVGRGVTKEYQDMARSFTCCVGTGMENHALHGLGLYNAGDDRLWVNVYAPSTATWEAAGLKLEMDTTLPEGDTASLKIVAARAKPLTLLLRRPRWAGDGFSVSVNGAAEGNLPKPSSYVELKRTWKAGDTIAVAFRKTLYLEPLANDPRRTAIMWGPLMLAGDLGPEPARPRGGSEGGRRSAPPPIDVPAIVSTSRDPGEWLMPIDGKPGEFQTSGVGRDKDIALAPFYRLHRRTYMGYFDVYTPADWDAKKAKDAAEAERQRQLEAATVAYLQPGNAEREREFNQQGESTAIARVDRRAGRGGRGWFSYDVPVDGAAENVLVATYHADNRRPRSFDVLVDGQPLAHEAFDISSDDRFFDREYPIPATLTQGKQKVTVRFQASDDNDIAALFGLRVVRR